MISLENPLKLFPIFFSPPAINKEDNNAANNTSNFIADGVITSTPVANGGNANNYNSVDRKALENGIETRFLSIQILPDMMTKIWSPI